MLGVLLTGVSLVVHKEIIGQTGKTFKWLHLTDYHLSVCFITTGHCATWVQKVVRAGPRGDIKIHKYTATIHENTSRQSQKD